jgi:hypothetical protein
MKNLFLLIFFLLPLFTSAQISFSDKGDKQIPVRVIIQQDNSNLFVSFLEVQDLEVSKYEVQYSNEGDVFFTLSKITPVSGKFRHNLCFGGVEKSAYVRIKIVLKDGEVLFSRVIVSNSVING